MDMNIVSLTKEEKRKSNKVPIVVIKTKYNPSNRLSRDKTVFKRYYN